MASTADSMEWSIRPSQVIGVFGPGAIYDNLKDSMLILGTDFWDPKSFEHINDPHLLDYVRSGDRRLRSLKYFASVSSPKKEHSIPVMSFPSWGVCPECHLLQRRRGDSREFRCTSEECRRRRRTGTSGPPRTLPVRFMSACENGHIGDFPFYEWVHSGRTGTRECTSADALLYLKDSDTGSPSLDSKLVECRKCGLKRDMGLALARTGIRLVTKLRCGGRNPWLKLSGSEDCDLDSSGMLKGSSNVYFPVIKSSITIPPFSDELSRKVMSKLADLRKLSDLPPDTFSQVLVRLFDTRSEDNPEGKYSAEQILEKYRRISSGQLKEGLDIFELEFAQLNGGLPVDDEEFKMRPSPTPCGFGGCVDRVAQVEKLRQIVTITGFTRIHPPAGFGDGGRMAYISSEPPEWLPAAENRGEGIFLSLSQEKLKLWEDLPGTVERVRKVVAGPAGSPETCTLEGKAADARYVLLHTLSHMLIRSLSDLAGYSTSSMRERIYSSETMAGILIFTSSPSSDGSLGGLAEQGGDNFEQVLRRAVERSRSCSSDPLCSFSEPGGMARHGAACHTCTLLPEPACEAMNLFLDRAAVHSTLKEDGGGFFSA